MNDRLVTVNASSKRVNQDIGAVARVTRCILTTAEQVAGSTGTGKLILGADVTGPNEGFQTQWDHPMHTVRWLPLVGRLTLPCFGRFGGAIGWHARVVDETAAMPYQLNWHAASLRLVAHWMGKLHFPAVCPCTGKSWAIVKRDPV